ncbi:MAG: hypothetical protein L3I91_01075 [Mycoplasma sp.]
MINTSGWIITLTVIGFLILSLMLFEFYMHIVINACSIFRVNKKVDKGFIVNTVVLIISLIAAIILLTAHLAKPDEGYLFHTLVWWVISFIFICFLTIRVLITIHFNKVKLNPIVIRSLNPNELLKIFKIKDEQEILNHQFKKSIWKQYLTEDLNNLKQQIKAITHNYQNQDINKIITNLVLFLEQYTISFYSFKRKYTVCIFKDLVNQFQAQLKKNNC